jgi:hypothetical protein
MKKIILIGFVLVLMMGFSFAAVNNVCENIHVDVKMQDTYFGGNFGQTVCLSGFQPSAYFVNYVNPRFIFVVHPCTQPIQEQNLLRFFYCRGLN